MPQADLLVELFKSATNGDQLRLRKTAENLIQEEKNKGHRILADRLTNALKPSFRNVNHHMLPQKPSDHHKDLIYETVPERSLQSLVLPNTITEQIEEVVQEQHRAELLHSHNLRARNRLLFAGPPGNGKTSLAEALAHELMYPLLVIRYETLVGSYLGETSTRLKHVLDYAKTQRCVVFFDEFETLAKERGDTHETGEIKRVVSSLLLQVDGLPDYVVVVAASNHSELLDRAVWRRFQVRIELPMPTPEQLTHYIERLSERCETNFGYSAKTLAERLGGINFAEVEEFCLSVVRMAVLNRQTDNAQKITRLKLDQWKGRLQPTINRKAS